MLRFAVDIGGTFTDVTAFDPATNQLQLGKSLTTPPELIDGVIESITTSGADIGEASSLIHGSTIAINALLERRGARTALITTAGFRDVYEIGRINRPQSFNLFFRKPVPLVPRDRIFEIAERLSADGSVQREFPADAARRLAQRLAESEVEAVAILFLHSYRNPQHELAMRDVIKNVAPHLFVTTSHELSREYREYERTATVVANAYIGPLVSNYVGQLELRLREEGYRHDVMIMQSSGGVCDVDTVRRQCVQMVESGPAGGVIGTIELCEVLGFEKAISFDMGGTTAKACVVQHGSARLAPEYFVGGYDEGHPIRVPVLDIKEVGTGGGSIASVADGAGLRVGPESAGAAPGPVCYGAGGSQPTITDAHVVLGRLAADAFLGGRMALDTAAATAAIGDHVATPLTMDVHTAALGVVAVGTAAMANAVRAVTTERGLDPRDFALVAYGGAGPLHAASVARELHVGRVVIPFAPGNFSALGMLMADFRRDFVQTYFTALEDVDIAQLEALYQSLETQGTAELNAAGVTDEVELRRAADMRYKGQEHAVDVPWRRARVDEDALAELTATFHTRHEEEYRHHAPDQPVEIVSVRVSVIGRLDKPGWPELPTSTTALDENMRSRPVWFSTEGPLDCRIVDRPDLRPGQTLTGPLMVQEAGSATCVPPDAELEVDKHGNLQITLNKP